tara:strand:- start:190 stop:912 length:723 start_codon:yes stop_codon:yes gene_type:complete
MQTLVIDIGNTTAHFGVIEDNEVVVSSKVLTSSLQKSPLSELRKYNFKAIGISSVVPSRNHEILDIVKKMSTLYPVFIDYKICPIELLVDNPTEVGADRICNSVAASHNNTSTIVIDFGSATTFDVVNSNGNFIGGAICPGMDIAARNLFNAAELLSNTPFKFPDTVIGRSTKSNLQSGIMYGTVSMVEGMIKMISKELQQEKIDIIITGGFGKLVSSHISIKHIYDPYLTLRGINYIIC